MRVGLSGVLLVVACATERISTKRAEPPADLVFRNGEVYTVDAVRSWASAVAVRGGLIVYGDCLAVVLLLTMTLSSKQP